jgi:hypothetical protein
MSEDRLWEGTLKVVANAGQTFHVRVLVDVQGNRRGWFRSRPASGTLPATTAAMTPTVANTPMASMPPVPTSSASAVPASVGLGQMMLVGAFLGLVARLTMVLPADLFARLLGSTVRSPVPGSLSAWLQTPSADDGFLRVLALATWWVGALIGGLLVWRGGGRWTDTTCGLLAGAIAGLAGGVTVGCALVIGDALPRTLLLGLLGDRVLGPIAATPLWIVTALMCWMGLGALLGLVLGLCGQTGGRVLAWLATPVVWLLRTCGLASLAEAIEMHEE